MHMNVQFYAFLNVRQFLVGWQLVHRPRALGLVDLDIDLDIKI